MRKQLHSSANKGADNDRVKTSPPESTASKIWWKVTELSIAALFGGLVAVVCQVSKPLTTYLDVKIAKIRFFDRPTEGNLTGTWDILLGDMSGTMTVSQLGNRVSGFYQLHPFGKSDNFQGTIQGAADQNLTAYFLWDSQTVRWYVTGKVDQSPSVIQILGTAKLSQISKDGEWSPEAQVVDFHATAER